MPREIEIKLKITNDQLKNLKAWLEQNAQFKGQVHHIEYYLNNPQQTFFFTSPEGFKDALDFLRVRLSDKGDSVCLKRFERMSNAIDSKNLGEWETDVADGKALLELFRNLGYTEETIIDKVRDKYLTKEFEIVIDQVKDLGTFVEVELLKQVETHQEGWDLIRQFLLQIGISQYREAKRGYTSMLWNPNYDFTVVTNLESSAAK